MDFTQAVETFGNTRPQNADEVASLADELLTFLEASEANPVFRHGAHGMTDVHQFDGAMTIADVCHAWGNSVEVMSEEEMRDPAKWLSWPLDAVWCMKYDEGGWPEGTWSFNRIRTCDIREARGRAALITPKMLVRDYCYITPDGARQGLRRFLAFSGGRWIAAYKGGQRWSWIGDAGNDTQRPEPISHREEPPHNGTVSLAFSIMLTRRYHWSVCLSYGGPSIRFLTDPTGVREIFKLRDLPEGKLRRAALRHWVAKHHRRSRADEAALIDIRRHLRGATKFTWNGLTCVIEPSGLDLELNRNHH